MKGWRARELPATLTRFPAYIASSLDSNVAARVSRTVASGFSRKAICHAASTAADALIAVTLAPRCVACERPLDSPTRSVVCDRCWTLIRPLSPPLCRTCGDPLASWRTISLQMECCAACRRRPTAVDIGRAAGGYEGTLRAVIHAFKYDGRHSLARPLARMMQDAAGEVLTGVACAVPVPLHPWRQLRRGFNQAAVLAARLDLPVVAALWRARATIPQTGLTAAARRRNVRDAFRPSPLVPAVTIRSLLVDRPVLLVDDVKTTGATLDACARALKELGVSEVRALTVARAAPPAHGSRP